MLFRSDPRPWIERYAHRAPIIHIKDVAPAGQNAAEEGWADIGAGLVPWAELWPLCVAAGAEIMVAEHDKPSDFKRFATGAAKAMGAFAKGGK